MDESLLRAGDLGFLVGLGAICVLVARHRGRFKGRNRDLELTCLIIIALLAPLGFALAHAGMNYSWTGHAVISDWRWTVLPIALVSAVFAAHLALRLTGSRIDEVALPVLAVLSLLGLIGVHVWEVRDANAYISGRALPSMHQHLRELADAPTDLASSTIDTTALPRSPDATKALLASLPDETAYELHPDGSGRDAYATVLNPEWVRAYNDAVERFSQHVARYPLAGMAPPEPQQISVASYTHRQAVATVLALLSVPIFSLLLTSSRFDRLLGRRRFLIASGTGLAALSVAGAVLSKAAVPNLPLLSGVGVYEPLKLSVVVFLAGGFACYRTSRGAGRPLIAILAGSAVIAALLAFGSRDFGSGLVLSLLAGGIVIVAVAARYRGVLLAVGGVSALALLLGLCFGAGLLPSRTQGRIEGWLDPAGNLEAATRRDAADLVFERIVQRRQGEGDGARQPVKLIAKDLDAVVQELQWRLKEVDRWYERKAEPLVPATAEEELLLADAETLWYAIGGYDPAATVDSPSDVRMLSSRIGGLQERFREALRDLRSDTPRPSPTDGDGLQLLRARAALDAGGLLGVGLGRGRPEMIPGVTEDAAFAANGEALGAAGSIAVIVLLGLLVLRPLRPTESSAPSPRELLARGCALALGLQAVISVAGLLGVLPYTGVGYPLISRSGMSVLVSAFMVTAIGAATIHAVPLEWVTHVSGAPSPERRRLVGAIARAGMAGSAAYLLFNLLSLPLARRSLAPGTLPTGIRPADLPGSAYQWRAPEGYRHLPGPILDRHGDLIVEARARASGWSSTGWSSPDAEMAACSGHIVQALAEATVEGLQPDGVRGSDA